MRKLTVVAVTVTALVALAVAAPASASAKPRPELGAIEIASAVNVSPGRALEIARDLHLTPSQAAIDPPTRIIRLGRRAVLVNTTLWVVDPNRRAIPIMLLVRERPRSGRIVVRVVL